MLKSDGYAYRQSRVNGKKVSVFMHHAVIGKPTKMVDHINHDTLDNRRSNLRFVDSHTNQLNRRGLQSNNTTGYNGVCKYRGASKVVRYAAIGKREGKKFYVGVFSTPLEACIARQAYLSGGQ